MNKRPGHVVVTTEVAVCTFCGRPRTLRNEKHQLGTLVRTIVTCETCHRTLSSAMSVASAEPAAPEPAAVESELAGDPPARPRPTTTPSAKSTAKTTAKPGAPKAAATATGAESTAPKSRTQKKSS